METIIIIAASVINVSIFGYILYYVKHTRLDASLLAYTQNLAQEKTKLSDSLKTQIRMLRESGAKSNLRIAQLECRIKQYQSTDLGQTVDALHAAEAKNESEYKRGWDDCLDEQKSGKLEVEGADIDEIEEDVKASVRNNFERVVLSSKSIIIKETETKE
jgi:hypothetical protein